MGRQSRRRRSELRCVRLCNVARAVPDLHRPFVPPDAHPRRPARAAGRQAGTVAPGAGASDFRTFAADAALRPRVRYPARPDAAQRTAPHDPVRRTDRRIALALDTRTGDVVVDPERRAEARRRRLHLAWQGQQLTDDNAFDQIELARARWTWWAGLEAVAPLQRGGAPRRPTALSPCAGDTVVATRTHI